MFLTVHPAPHPAHNILSVGTFMSVFLSPKNCNIFNISLWCFKCSLIKFGSEHMVLKSIFKPSTFLISCQGNYNVFTHTWNSSTSSQENNLCLYLVASILKGLPATFWYDFLFWDVSGKIKHLVMTTKTNSLHVCLCMPTPCVWFAHRGGGICEWVKKQVNTVSRMEFW